jgi:hypothetical protein
MIQRKSFWCFICSVRSWIDHLGHARGAISMLTRPDQFCLPLLLELIASRPWKKGNKIAKYQYLFSTKIGKNHRFYPDISRKNLPDFRGYNFINLFKKLIKHIKYRESSRSLILKKSSEKSGNFWIFFLPF